ncbi:glycosyl hydrolase [Sediminibacterium soli]|uniref:glycosyl hydrolase n=1 Tax=Sediminibacterium soli TaxID=2698829 RepID=UPI00137A358D|nr:glycosyl hydrolase [Sediminibacterium soli]NCI46854.1 glycoside hydrolase family 2 protein [Sediminibacterium soli]
MNRNIIVLAIALIVSLSSNAQPSWPRITQTARPWTRWWWEGSAVDKAGLTAAMQQYKEAGLGGLEITPIYGVKGYEARFIDFLSPKWMDMLGYTLQEGKRLGLGIDMANATGWPFGGPWVKPEDACRNINFRTWVLKEGQRINDTISYRQQPFYRSESRMKIDVSQLQHPVAANPNLQLYALDQLRYEQVLLPSAVIAYDTGGQATDLTSKLGESGRLNWTAPRGEWKLVALFTGYHGKLVERAAPGGEGDVIDHFKAEALQHYLAKFDQAFKGRDLRSLRSFFNDSYEVDDAKGQANWTNNMLSEFRKRRGYDIRQYLPLLLQRDSTETGRRVLADYRQTVSDLLLDNFTLPWHRWAKSKNKMVRNQSHGSPANILDLYAVVDIPETEGADILRFKFATSTAHVMGKPLASAETATWLNEHFQSSLGDVKQAVDKYFVGGVNHVFWHGTNYSPQNDPWPGWLFYAAVHFTPANPFWKDISTLNNYVARCQSFLQKGKSDNDLLLYFPFNDRIVDMGRDLLLHFDGMEGFDKTVFKTSAEWLLQKGYAFDLVSDKQVMDIRTAGDRLQTSGGGSYRTIVLADVKYIPIETMSKLFDAARQGATIVFYRNLPSMVPGLSDLSKRQALLQQLTGSLSFTNKGTIRQASIGKGSILVGDDMEQLLLQAKTTRETLVDKGLQFARRKYDDGRLYFISNPTAASVSEWVTLETNDRHALLFDPMTLEAGVARTRNQGNKLEVLLSLRAGASCIVQSVQSPPKAGSYPYRETTGTAIPLREKWQLQFTGGSPVLPARQNNIAPGSWTDGNDAAAKNFSGTAVYTTHFLYPAVKAEWYELDLGSVQESAEVFVNGKRLATLIGPVFKLSIPASLLTADNELKIAVTNGMANRIADMDKKGIPWKKFYNTNFPSRLPQNRGADGIFTAAQWQPKPSGLLGPVTIQPLQKIK